MELPDGRMMFGNGSGVIVYDGTKWSRTTHDLLRETSCPSGTIDAEGTVWFATRSHGVLRYRDDQWTALTTDDGLLSNEVATIAAGKSGDVWASTTGGLCRFDGSRFYRVDLPGHFGRKSLRSERDGSIWLDGAHRYVPDRNSPVVVLEEESIKIEANASGLIRWRGVDAWNRTAADKLTWSHRIDGGRWSPFYDESQFVLENLSSGKHRVDVRSRDKDFNVSETPQSVSVSVSFPVWMRPWFLALVALSLAVVTWQSDRLIRKGIALRHSHRELASAKSQLAERFAEKSAQFRAICDCSPTGIFVTDVAGKVTYINQFLGRIGGFGGASGLGDSWTDAIHPDDRGRVVAAWVRAITDSTSFNSSGRFVHSHGTIVWFEVVADRILSDGECIGYVGAVEDVTQDVIAREELRMSNSKLSCAVEQLQHAQDQAIKRERLSALGQMSAGVAHDINNALAPLLTYAELLAGEPGIQGSSREWVELIRLGVSDTAGIAKRLEHFYRDSHNPELLESVDLADVVTQSVDLTRPKWKNSAVSEGKRVDVRIEKVGRPKVDCHPAQIRSVLTNLIFNAVDAIEDQGTVTIRLAESSGRVVLEVIDDGLGMTNEQVDRCPEPFYTTKRKGSGLGLSECHGIIRQHGGTIQVASSVARGTTVHIELPVSIKGKHATLGDAGYVLDVADRPVSESIVHAHPEKNRILYIEDDDSVRRSTVALLQVLGVEVEAVPDGLTGLTRLAESSFQMVLCDQGLPGMDGITVLNEIKRRWPTLPVIIVSGWSLQDTGDGAQPDAFLEKPAAFESLRAVLDRYLSSAGAA
jgi:PAS domain S-box-containing protein